MHPLLAAVVLLGLAAGARAQGLPALAAAAATAKAPDPKAAEAKAGQLSPAETKQMIDLLNDPQKRAAFTATLETLAKASAVAAPGKPAAVKLAPDSLGAEVLKEGTAWLGGLSGQVASLGQVLGDLPSLWRFTVRTGDNPVLRARALDAAWRLALVLGVAGLGEWAMWRLMRRPVRALARLAPPAGGEAEAGAAAGAVSARVEAAVRAADAQAAVEPGAAAAAPTQEELEGAPAPAGPVELHEAAVVEHVLRRRRFSRTVRTLKRLPFVLLGFVLDLLPAGVFAGIGYAGTLFATPHMQAVLQAAILAYATCRVATALARMFTAPGLPSLRLIHVSEAGAAYAVRWVRRVFAIAAFGFAASQIGLLFGLPPQADDAFLKAVFLVVHLCLIVIVLQCRAPVAARLRSPKLKPGPGGRLRNWLATVWHLVAIFYIAALWMVWAAEVRHGYLRIWHLFLVTVGVVVVARLMSIVVLGGLDRAFRVSPEAQARYPGLEKRADRYYPLLRRTASALLIVLTGLALLFAWGVNTLAWFGRNALGGKLAGALLTVLVAAAIAVVVWEAVNASMDGHLARLQQQMAVAKAARLRTLMPILRTVLLAGLVAVFGLTALSEDRA